ncbi:hypothetical protein GTZ99_10170 [Novosphingobium sp. FSY-8]|uniref:Uncharacterized protein n=1 Tax=Novosphingobium ovatum TaxID=1908523 RepID=A0ABW9XEH6_9SPHN|nr:hypothetical protein [Novosphingobium ovatum]NBC36922.1 hypothetical protein [Novosphingobium ovatum]
MLLGSAPARADGFINSGQLWGRLSPAEKSAYVLGLNDSINYVFVDDTLVNALAKRGRTTCLRELKITPQSLVEKIDLGYRDNAMLGFPPAVIYILKMSEVCKVYVDRERAAFGLGPS